MNSAKKLFFETFNLLFPFGIVIAIGLVTMYVFSFAPGTEAAKTVNAWNHASTAEQVYTLYVGLPAVLIFIVMPIMAFSLMLGNKDA